MPSTLASLKEGSDGSHALSWGSQVVSRWRRGWKGTGRQEVKSEKKAWWLWFSRVREFETTQWRELGESGILIDLSFRENVGVSLWELYHANARRRLDL
jgi:hypothetical protein